MQTKLERFALLIVLLIATALLCVGAVPWTTALLCLPVFGAVTVTVIAQPSGQNALKDLHVAQVAATADADVAATITHNFGLPAGEQAFTEVTLTLLQSQIAAQQPGWFVSARGANTVTIGKNATAGTGLAGVQVECRVKRPHTFAR